MLLLHGFTGTPFEVRLLGEHLDRLGYPCEAPLLAGHNAPVSELSRSRWHDWLDSAQRALLALHQRLAADGDKPRIAVIGLSMGGLLTLELARRCAPLIQTIGVLAAPLWLKAYQMRAISAVSGTFLSRLSLPKLFGSDVREAAMRHKNPASAAMPLAALASLVELMHHVKAHLGEVHQPAFVAYAVQDHVVPYACLDALLLGLGTPRSALTCLSLPQSYHLITLDVEREMLFAAIAQHLALHLGPP